LRAEVLTDQLTDSGRIQDKKPADFSRETLATRPPTIDIYCVAVRIEVNK